MFLRLNLLVNGQESPVINLVQELAILLFSSDFAKYLAVSDCNSLPIDCLLIVSHAGINIHIQFRSLDQAEHFRGGKSVTCGARIGVLLDG